MAVAGSLTYDTKIDSKGFEKGLSSLENSVQSGGTKIRNIVAALGIDKIISATMNTIKNSVGDAVSRIDTLNNYPKVMQNLGISSEDAEASIKKLSEKLTGLPTTLDSASSAVQRFTSKNGDINKSTDYFLALNNALLAGGASADIQSSALEQLSQAYAKGKLDMQEWRSIQTAMPAQLNQVAQSFNMTSDELGEALRSGKISMDDFMDKIVELNDSGSGEFLSFEEQAKNSTGGISTSVTNMKTAITRGVAEIITSIDDGLQQAGLGSLSEVINNIGTVAEKTLKGVSDKIPDLIGNLGQIAPALGTVVTGFNLLDGKSIVNFGKKVSNFSSDFGKNLTGNINKTSEFSLNVSEKFQNMSNNLDNKGGKINGVFSKITGNLSNLSLGFATGLDSIDKNTTSKIGNVISIAGKLTGTLSTGLGFSALGGLALVALGLLEQNFGDTINNLLQKATDEGPAIITNLVNGIVSGLPQLIEQGGQLVQSLLNVIIINLPSIIQGGIQIVSSLVTGLAQQLPTLIPMALELILTLVTSLLDNIDQLIDSGIQLIMGLAEGLINAIPKLIEKIPTIIEKLLNAITKNLPKIIQMGIIIIVKLATGLIKAIPQLVSKIPQIMNAIVSSFKSLISSMWDVGKNLVDGIWNGIRNAKDWLLGKVKEWCGSILDGMKAFFGIHSPSKVMRDEIGKFIPQGVAVGIEADTDEAVKAIRSMDNEIMNEMNKAVSAETGSINANASVKSNNSMLNVIQATFNIDGSVDIDGQKAGRILTPHMTKTLRGAGAY